MEQNTIQSDVVKAVANIKFAIQQTRRTMMLNANKNALALYYGIGRYISQSQKKSNWGDKVLETISSLLQQEMPGLKGFSKTSLKRMRVFYKCWQSYFDFANASDKNSIIAIPEEFADNEPIIIGPLTTDQFDKATLNAFLTVQFTHHSIILSQTEDVNERLFYIRKVAKEFWSVDKLQYNIREQLYMKEGTLPNNFAETLPDSELKQKAMRAFRMEWSLDDWKD